VRMSSLQTELVAKRAEKALLTRATDGREKDASRDRSQMLELRGADVVPASPK